MDTIYEFFTYRKSQSLIISGESGAGKTETAKNAIKFICYYFINEFNQKCIGEVRLEDKILSCSPILASFGNAKTSRNDNSSRFGKFIKLFIDIESKRIMGANISIYLLEKSRVVKIMKGERNFHIFYQIFSGFELLIKSNFDMDKLESKYKYFENEILKKLILVKFNSKSLENYSLFHRNDNDEMIYDNQHFNFLKNDIFKINNYNDGEMFLETLNDMINTGFSFEKIGIIFNILCAILHLGNIEFIDNKNENVPCSIKNDSEFHLKKASNLLNIDKDTLQSVFTMGSRNITNQLMRMPLKYSDCIIFRDNFAKEIYHNLFDYIVMELNKTISFNEINENKYMFIGILDIFGFETFDINSFEQFCINYTNEKLHQLYIKDLFKIEEILFKNEGLGEHFKNIDFDDNKHILDVMDLYPNGIYCLIDNECNYTQRDDLLLNVSKINKIENFSYS